MSKTLEFKAFCFEAYRAEKKMTGRETMALFKKYGVLEYIGLCFDVLQIENKLLNGINIFMYRSNVFIVFFIKFRKIPG